VLVNVEKEQPTCESALIDQNGLALSGPIGARASRRWLPPQKLPGLQARSKSQLKHRLPTLGALSRIFASFTRSGVFLPS
jgi:hypothetical protein